MEAIASGNNKNRYLKSKANEIKSLKRRFELELSEAAAFQENLSSLDGKNTAQFAVGDVNKAQALIKETDTFLNQNNVDQLLINIQDSDALSTNNLFGDDLRKERAGELFQYGFEVKYLPLARYLQTASKYISTDNWCAAREEFRLARVFDRYLELRTAKASTLLQIPQQQYPMRQKTQHDVMLEEIPWMSNDFSCEREWKISMAKRLAIEAREFVLKKLCVWSNSKAVCKIKPLSISSEYFYRDDSKLDLIEPAELVEKLNSVESSELVPIDRDELAELCNFGDKLDNSLVGDLITTAEYQLGTSASFPSITWYEHEDALLLEFCNRYKRNWLLISCALNTQIYGGKVIRGPQSCQERLEELEKKSVTPKPQLTSLNPPLIHPHLLEKHNVKLGLMRGSNTKIITPRSIVPKKISFNVHPSHEAAARKANQNISKLLTPSELAQKRLQRTRLVNEAGTLNAPPIPRSTPSPNPSASGMQNPMPQATNSGAVPNLPPMPAAVSSGPPVYNNMNASAAAQQIAAGMMRTGMIRPPPGKVGPSTNPMIAQLQQLQQLQQYQQSQQQQQQQMQMQQSPQFGDSPSKAPQTYRPPMPGQARPPSANGPINFMNLPPGITPLQIQQLQQKQSQVNQFQQQQAQQAQQQMQQMYAKTMQSRPPNPSASLAPKNPLADQPPINDQSAANNANLRTSPRKSSNK